MSDRSHLRLVHSTTAWNLWDAALTRAINAAPPERVAALRTLLADYTRHDVVRLVEMIAIAAEDMDRHDAEWACHLAYSMLYRDEPTDPRTAAALAAARAAEPAPSTEPH